MPWIESCAVDERVEFIADWLAWLWTVTELAERYGVSRKTAYKWIGRYAERGPSGLEPGSSAPLRHGRATPAALREAILQQKEARPTWGPRKIIAKLSELHPELGWPVASTAGEILKRAGLTQRRRWRRRAPPSLGGLTEAQAPNDVWAADHKGWVLLGDGQRCEPLTVSDSYSRFLIALSACQSTREAEARPVFERAFAAFGLPR